MIAKARLLVFVGLMLALCGPGLAQDETAPFLQILALVPDTTAIRASIISYADYRAMEAARSLDTPSALDFMGQKSDLAAQWIAASSGINRRDAITGF